MRVRPDKRAAVAALVADISADARLTEKGAEHLSFSLPQSSLDLPSLFAEVPPQTPAIAVSGLQEFGVHKASIPLGMAGHE